MQVFLQRFIPFPAVYSHTVSGMKALDPDTVASNPKAHAFASLTERLVQKLVPASALHHTAVPFDFYCPSMQGKLNEGIFPKCGMYWRSKAALGRHMPCHNVRRSAFEQKESDSEIEDSEKCTDEDEVMPVFDNIFEIFQSPFIVLE